MFTDLPCQPDNTAISKFRVTLAAVVSIRRQTFLSSHDKDPEELLVLTAHAQCENTTVHVSYFEAFHYMTMIKNTYKYCRNYLFPSTPPSMFSYCIHVYFHFTPARSYTVQNLKNGVTPV